MKLTSPPVRTLNDDIPMRIIGAMKVEVRPVSLAEFALIATWVAGNEDTIRRVHMDMKPRAAIDLLEAAAGCCATASDVEVCVHELGPLAFIETQIVSDRQINYDINFIPGAAFDRWAWGILHDAQSLPWVCVSSLIERTRALVNEPPTGDRQ